MDITLNYNFIDGAFVEILGNKDNKNIYTIKFINKKTNFTEYQTDINVNKWAKTAKKYFIDWKIEIYNTNKLIFTHEFNLNKKRVLIELCSSSLGDTLAWFPAIEQFRKLHNCEVYCSTFLNNLFKSQYPDLNFIEPGQVVDDIYAQYRIGWFYNNDIYDSNMNPCDFKKFHLQATAFQILGMEFNNEIKPNLNVPVKQKKRQVCIGIHSTAQAKYWNNPNGWQTVVDYLNKNNYEVHLITKEHNGWMNNKVLTGIVDKTGNYSLQDRLEQLAESELFIGLGSGLSWLAWASGIKTILISGFSEKYAEFKPDARIINESVCHGCFNNTKLDPSDWNWCPVFKNTDKQFVCTKEIHENDVITAINNILNL